MSQNSNFNSNRKAILNPQKEPLTPAKLKELTSLNFTDAEADEIIHSIRLFCKVLYQFSAQSNMGYIEGQPEIKMYEEQKREAA